MAAAESLHRFAGKIALVTGASGGIGKSICRALVKEKMTVIGCARSLRSMDDLEKELNVSENSPGMFVKYRCDLTNEEDIVSMHDYLRGHFRNINVCINNAVGVTNTSLLDGETEEWRQMLEVGILGLCINTREVLKSMTDRTVPPRHIIQMGSNIEWLRVLQICQGSRIYKPDMHESIKHMTCSLANGLRQDLDAKRYGIKVATIRPGLVKTDLLARSTNKTYADGFFKDFKHLQPEDVAAAVTHILKAPSHVNIQDIVLHPLQKVCIHPSASQI